MQTQSPSPSPHLLRNLPQRLPRLSGWLLVTLALMLAVLLIAPHQLPVSLYKLSLVSLAGVVGYWLDRSLFPYARPDVFLVLGVAGDGDEADGPDGQATLTLQASPDEALLRLMGQAMLRRAVIVAAAMVAMGLGA